MLNMSVTPQIKSTADSVAGLVNSDFSDNRESSTEEFGKILEREVSEGANKPHSAADKQNKDADQQSENVTVTLTMESDSTHTNEASPANVGNLVQTILNDTASAYKIDASLMPDTSVINAEVNAVLTAVPSIATLIQQQQSALVSQNNGQVPSSTLPMVNQLLQQKLMQQNLEENNLTVLSENLVQSFEPENSAVFGKVLPLLMAGNDAQNSLGDMLTSVPDEITTGQSFGLNNGLISSAATDATMTDKVHVNTPVGHARWGEELAQKVVWMTSQQTQVAEIRLNPAHLGPVEVMLSISQDQATAQFVSQHPAVRDAIQDALPRLREMLAESGIQLGNVMVGADSFQQENKQQQAQQFDKSATSVVDSSAEAATPIEIGIVSTRHHGLVNTYA